MDEKVQDSDIIADNVEVFQETVVDAMSDGESVAYSKLQDLSSIGKAANGVSFEMITKWTMKLQFHPA